MMSTPKKILEAKSLAVGYFQKGQTRIVASAINLELYQGELVAVVGANGVGKSTLLRTLSQVQKPLEGSIKIDERYIESYTPLALATALSLVLTDPIASRNLTVLELVALGRQPYTNWIGTFTKTDIQKTKSALEQMHILDLSDKKCFEISDGQLQKALIARAIAQDTSLIILDEPTTHLDIYHKTYVLKLMQKLTRDLKKTLFFSTHEIDLAIQLCDKIFVMTPTSMYYGTPKELIEKGCFSALFPKDLIGFDGETGRFHVCK